MTKDEALKLALEALEEAHYKIEHKQDVVKREQAITAIKEALAQTEQEPVAVYRAGQAKGEVYHVQFLKEMDADEVLLYTTPPQRKPLTDEEIWEALGGIDCTRPMLIARAIEAKLKERNG